MLHSVAAVSMGFWCFLMLLPLLVGIVEIWQIRAARLGMTCKKRWNPQATGKPRELHFYFWKPAEREWTRIIFGESCVCTCNPLSPYTTRIWSGTAVSSHKLRKDDITAGSKETLFSKTSRVIFVKLDRKEEEESDIDRESVAVLCFLKRARP